MKLYALYNTGNDICLSQAHNSTALIVGNSLSQWRWGKYDLHKTDTP